MPGLAHAAIAVALMSISRWQRSRGGDQGPHSPEQVDHDPAAREALAEQGFRSE